MASCPRCGQSYAGKLDYCLYCGYDLRQPSPNQAPPPRIPERKTAIRNLLLIVLIAIVAVYALAVAVGPMAGGGRQTWQQYGMSIQYPSGVKTQYQGVLNQQPDLSSGEAEWLWNGGNTGLAVVWITSPSANISAGLQGITHSFLSSARNVTETALGNVTMASRSWEYLSFSFTINGTKSYGTVAVAYQAASSRVYFIGYFDADSNTMQSIESYGNTFTG